MKRTWLVVTLLGLSWVGTAYAQDERFSYFGVGVTAVTNLAVIAPMGSVQVGGPVSDFLELRATLNSNLAVNYLGADLLATFRPNENVKPYVGVGGALGLVIGLGAFYDVFGTAGVEYLPGSVGFFAEGQLSVVSFAIGTPAGNLRAGVNFHF